MTADVNYAMWPVLIVLFTEGGILVIISCSVVLQAIDFPTACLLQTSHIHTLVLGYYVGKLHNDGE